ncbi:hypothetical protein JQ586_34615 [Bradyrhizobium jicamae]|nr:hypothetical protein [Bradyrhizobium jicamae]
MRVGAISTALVALMPTTLGWLSEQHPNIEIKVVLGTSAGLLKMLDVTESILLVDGGYTCW